MIQPFRLVLDDRFRLSDVPRRGRGFTLLEMLTTVAALVILLGLMVSLARDVRSRSAARLTQELLSRLDEATAQYVAQSGKIPPSISFITGEHVDEKELQQRAFENNRSFALTLLRQPNLARQTLESLSIMQTPGNAGIRDAWGGPIVFMPSQHPSIGMAPGDRPFFVSAGPDGRYLTRDDNLHSYDFTVADDFAVKKP